MVSTTHYISSLCLRGSFWCGEGKQNIYSKDRREGKEPPITQTAWVKLGVNQWSCPLDDLLRHSTPCDWLLQSYMTPSLPTMCPKQGGSLPRRWFIGCNPAALEADTIATRQAHAKENTNKIMISKVSNHFFKSAMI